MSIERLVPESAPFRTTVVPRESTRECRRMPLASERLNAVTVAGKSWRVPPAPNGSAATAEPEPTLALPQALSAASVEVFSIAFGSQPLAALVLNFMSFLENLMSALVAFGGIPLGLSASEVVVVTSTEAS